jgi:hypothetical protein
MGSGIPHFHNAHLAINHLPNHNIGWLPGVQMTVMVFAFFSDQLAVVLPP